MVNIAKFPFSNKMLGQFHKWSPGEVSDETQTHERLSYWRRWWISRVFGFSCPHITIRAETLLIHQLLALIAASWGEVKKTSQCLLGVGDWLPAKTPSILGLNWVIISTNLPSGAPWLTFKKKDTQNGRTNFKQQDAERRNCPVRQLRMLPAACGQAPLWGDTQARI